MPETLTIRHGGPGDADTLIGLFDEAVAWLVKRGQTGQWGSEPFSRRPEAIARVRGLAGGGGLRIAQLGDEVVGALVVGQAPAYAPVAAHPELYIDLLLTSRRRAGRQIGTRLVAVAIDEARAAGAAMVRVDCWAGAPTLVEWYRRRGFTPSTTFEIDGWRGQIFDLPLS